VARASDASPLKQERAKRTRQVILIAAARTIERVGYAGARLDEIGRDAEVTKGALYFHFRSKADIARALMEAHHERWREITRRVSGYGLDPLTTMVALSFAVARNYRASEIARAGVRLGNEYQSIDAELPRPFVGWIDRLTDLLRAAQAEGLIREDVDCPSAAAGVVASYFGVQEMSARLSGGKDLIRRLRAWWTLFLPALAGEEGAQEVLARITERGTVRPSE